MKLLVVAAIVGMPMLVLRAMDDDVAPAATAAESVAEPGAEPAARPGDTTAVCALESGPHPLPRRIVESSGIARTSDGSLWTHNDGAEAVLYRVDEGGQLRQAVRVEGADASDIEDIDAGPCPGGSGECLWLADTGDNDNERSSVALLVVPLPADGAESARPTRLAFSYPDGPRDAEALAVLPSGDAVVVSKGRDTPIVVYRLAGGAADGAQAGGARTADRIVGMAAEPGSSRDRVTGAGASEDGRWIAVRTNDALAVYRTDALLSGEVAPVFTHDLRPLRESQGEGVDLSSDGRVWLTSEGERGHPTLARMRCSVPE